MAQDPKKINPVTTTVKTYPGERTDEVALPTVPELLPQVFRTDTNKKLISAIMEDMFQPHAMEDLNYSVGRRTTKALINDYLPHPTAKRQLEPGLVVYRADGNPATLSADEVAQAWGFNDRSKEVPVPVSVLDLPINPDKFVNWVNYYWIEEGMPVIYITGGDNETFNVQTDIVGKPYYTTITQKNGRQLELKDGMRIVFQNPHGKNNQLLKQAIQGDLNFTLTTDGSDMQVLPYDFVAYDKKKINIQVDGVHKSFPTDYTILGNSIHWYNNPGAGHTVFFNCVDYYVTTDADSLTASRRWEVTGVGTPTGIRLLSRTYQYTNTVYSKATQTLWDKTAVPWDSVEWDGIIKGINDKHYILMAAGAENRNAHSRVNVWYHKDAIRTVANFLGLTFNDIVSKNGPNTNSPQAMRPIVEFDSTIEMYNHGTTYCAWVNLVVNTAMSPDDFVYLPIKDTDLVKLNPKYISTINKLKLVPDVIIRINEGSNIQTALNRSNFTAQEWPDLVNTPSKKILYQIEGDGTITWIKNAPNTWTVTYRIAGTPVNNLRILWLTTDQYQNLIVNITSNVAHTIGFVTEMPADGSATVADISLTSSPFYLREYHWVNGVATLAQTRMTKTQQPLFELYDADNRKLSANPNKPEITYSRIIEIVKGDVFDQESGYNLKFLTSQFSELTADNTASRSMYDIVYNHTLQNYSYYSQGTSNKTIKGPYQFRRITNGSINNELSIGYKRAWFRLKSWAVKTINNVTNPTVTLHGDVWPVYEYGIKLQVDQLKAFHFDDVTTEIVVDNSARVARNEPATFKIFLDNPVQVATVSGNGIDNFDVSIINDTMSFVVPADAPPSLTIRLGSRTLSVKVINVKVDPRNIQVKLNGLPTAYSFNLNRNQDFSVNTVDVIVVGTGQLEIQHQGNVITDEHITAIPGLALNPEQNINLGEFTPSRMVHDFTKAINANILTEGQSWIDGPKLNTAYNAIVVDNSSMRSAWTSMKMTPSIQDVFISRSLSAWRWYRKFIAKLESNFNLLDFSPKTDKENLDRILEDLLVGVTYSSADAVSGMAVSTNAMNLARFVGDGTRTTFTINTGSLNLYTDIYGNDLVYVYVNDVLLHKNEYTINATNKTVNTTVAPATNSTIEIYHASEVSAYSGIPASTAKLGLGGLYRPGFVTETWGTNTRQFIQRHDGSKIAMYGTDQADLRNQVILELENRIYNNCLGVVGKANMQRQFRSYRNREVLETQAKAQLEWYATNNINFQERTDYINGDPWTYNYGGQSWRGIYINAFDTYQLDTAPWEALGYDNKPSWWDANYSWTNTNKRPALEHALRRGILSRPGTLVTVNPLLARNFDSFPVDSNGVLIDPESWKPELYTVSADDQQQPWQIGSWGPAETAWRRSISGTWSGALHSVDDYSLINEFIDSSMNPFVNDVDNNSPKQKGFNTFPPSQFYQDRPTIGIGSAIFEAYREFNLSGSAPLNEIMSLDSRLIFGMGGFSDGVTTLKMYYAKGTNGYYIPSENFLMTLSNGVATSQLRYSAVRVEKDGVGFRVYGFDPGHRHFTIFNPITTQTAGRTTLTTPNGNFTSYLNYDSTTPVDVYYGTYIADKQTLFTFFEGLQAYQVYNGLILDQINSRGTINNWQQAALDSLEWIAENWGSSHYCVVSVATADGLKFKHARGALDRLDADLGRSGKILFANGRSALANELLITRDYEDQTDKIVPVTNDQIVFVDFATRDYDHSVYINRKTKYGELIIDMQMDNRIDVLALASRRTNGWTGRPTARGVLIQQNGLLPGFDALMSDVLNSHKPEQNAFDTIKTEIAKSNIVPAKYTVLDNLIQDKDSQHFYKQGLQTAMGTNLAIDAFFRNSRVDIPGRTQDVSVNEQWLINTGEFGNLQDQQIWEIELRKEDFTSNRQIIRFSPQGYRAEIRDSLDDNIIDIWEKDPRWITKPADSYNFATLDRATQTGLDATKSWLPNAGVPALFDADIQMRDLSNLSMTDFINVDQSSKPGNATINGSDATLSTSDIFSTTGFSRYINYQPGDYAWQTGMLYKAITKITGSPTSAFNSADWTIQPIDGRLLPSVWVSDYGFDKNTKYKGTWTPNTHYLAGDLITRNGHYEVCMINHTSGGQYLNNSIVTLSLVNGGSGYQVGDIIKTDTAIQVGNVSAIKNGKISAISCTDTVGGYTPATTTLSVVGGDGRAEVGAVFKTDTVLVDQSGQLGAINLPNGVTSIGNGYDISNVIVTVTGEGTSAVVTPIIQDNFRNGNQTRQGVVTSIVLASVGVGYAVDDVVILSNDSGGLEAHYKVTSVDSTGGILTMTSEKDLSGATGGQSYISGKLYNIRADVNASGSGATATVLSVITIELKNANGDPIPKYDDGVITGFNIVNPGTGYVSSTTHITITRPAPRATPVIVNGQIVGATLSAGAGGNILYYSDISITFHSKTGTGATATPIVTGNKLTGITITNPGSGYIPGLTSIEIGDPNWEEANTTGLVIDTLPTSTTTVVRSGVIDYIYIVDGGSGYATGAQVIITDPNRDPALPPTTALVSGVQNGIIGEIALTDTTAEFDTIPSVEVISSTGFGASAAVTVQLGQYWRLKTAGYGWNILQTFGPMYIEETCPNALNTGLNESKVSFASPHGMRENDYIILAGANDGNYDKVHQVKAIVDDFNLLIAARSTSDQIVYNMVAFKLLPIKFDSVEEFNQSKAIYNWVNGMKAYVVHDGQDDTAFNYDFTEYVWGGNPDGSIKQVNSETRMIDPNAIYKSLLLDEKSENVLTALEVYDPFKGCTINEATQYITHTLGVDPAVYNVSDLGILNKFISQAWSAHEVGTLWWDTSKVRYIEYERDITSESSADEVESPDTKVLESDEVRNINETTNLLYRASNWGRQFADSEVAIYEWTSSTTEPTIDVPGIYLDNSSGIDQVRYTVKDEPQANGGTVTTYYYWKRGSVDIPVTSTRPYSSMAIEETLNNPDANGISWISPIQVSTDSASIMVSNIGPFFAGRDRMILRIEQNKKPEQKHTTGQLLIEGLGGSIIPDFPFIRLRDSLVGMDKYRMIMPIQQYTQGNDYNIGDLVCYSNLDTHDFIYANSYSGRDIPVLPEINSIREDVKFVWPDDNSDRFGIFRVEVAITNAPGWDTVVNKILVPFETAIVKNVLEDNKYYAVIQRPRHVPDITLHPLRKYGNAYAPKPQSWYKDIQQARRTLIDAVNDNLLNVNATGKNTWSRLLTTWKPLLGSKSMDVTQYWYYADYVVGNYRPGNEVIKIKSFNELSNYTDATRFAIVNSQGVVDSVYNVIDINTNNFELIYKLNGTIQFYPIWQTSGWDQLSWDSKPWDQGFSDIYEIILRALREDIFVGADAGYFNLLFFAMVKEALVQNPTADWIFKTTYLSIESNSTNDLTPVAIFYDKKDALIKNYINEVKPYHSEVLDRGIFDNSLQQLDITVSESVSVAVTDTTYLTTGTGIDVWIDRQRNGNPVRVRKHDKLITEDGKHIITDASTTQTNIEER